MHQKLGRAQIKLPKSPSKREAEAMTDLERLGIWAARQGREEVKKSHQNIDDPQREE